MMNLIKKHKTLIIFLLILLIIFSGISTIRNIAYCDQPTKVEYYYRNEFSTSFDLTAQEMNTFISMLRPYKFKMSPFFIFKLDSYQSFRFKPNVNTIIYIDCTGGPYNQKYNDKSKTYIEIHKTYKSFSISYGALVDKSLATYLLEVAQDHNYLQANQ